MRLLGIALIVIGLAILTMGVSATIGIVHDRTARDAVPAATALPESGQTTRTTILVETPAGVVERTLDTPLGAKVDLPAVQALGVGASVKTSQVDRAQPQPPPQAAGARIESDQQTLLPPGAQALALGASVAAGAGLVAYFWSSIKRFAFVGLYAKITRAEVFDNDVRERIYHAIKANPGVSASDLAREAGVSWGTTIYHLEVLEQNRMVSSIRNGRHRRYFENGCVIATSKDVVAVLQNPVTATVERTIRTVPGVTQKDLAKATGMSPQALHWHLARLVHVGVVRKQREGRVVRHFASG